MFKIAVILGTRPEIIKISPTIKEAQQRGIDFFIIHTGQHYSAGMSDVFFDELMLPKPKYTLSSGQEGPGKLMIELGKILQMEKPSVVIVQGDTNSVLSGALAAKKCNIPVAHLEAGCRSFSNIPEENNRVVVDHISDSLFAPTEHCAKLLQAEGITDNVFVVGSLGASAAAKHLALAKKSEKLNLPAKSYGWVTAHRSDNVDNRDKLTSIINAINVLAEKTTLIFPIHPRTKKMVGEFDLVINPKVRVIEPVGYLESLAAISKAQFVITDSGGVQEEAAHLRVPCFTIRNETEWTESVEMGINKLVGTEANTIISHVSSFLNNSSNIKIEQDLLPAGAEKKVIDIVLKKYGQM